MKKGKYAGQKRSFGSKSLALMLALVLLAGGAVGGTLAWLTANSKPVENTFTTSNIEVHLEETDTDPETADDQYNYKMVPGHAVDKDPKAWVTETSEDCYLFIQVNESENLDKYIAYEIDKRWEPLQGVDGVYYMIFDSTSTDTTKPVKGTTYGILAEGSYTYEDMTFTWTDDQVLTLPTVKMEDMTAAESNKPLLSFTAYAVQLYRTNNEKFLPGEAWKHASKS